MRSSTEEAISLFNKWREERATLDFLFSSGDVSFGFTGYLLEASANGLAAVRDESADVTLSISLSGAASFDFADVREASEKSRPLMERTLVQALEITFRDGGKLGLYERKP